MKQIRNEFSWSKSRNEIFRTCPRLAPLRSAIEMLESWKAGIARSGEMEKWAIGEFLLTWKLGFLISI
jgi:hypothetical protein